MALEVEKVLMRQYVLGVKVVAIVVEVEVVVAVVVVVLRDNGDSNRIRL